MNDEVKEEEPFVSWNEAMSNLTKSWLLSPLGGYTETISFERDTPTWLRAKFYNIVYFIVYYSIRPVWIVWDAVEDAFNEAWGN